MSKTSKGKNKVSKDKASEGKTSQDKTSDMSFEQALRRLEEIVESLEEGTDVSLDEMIKAYGEGLGLAKLCQQKLEEAELKIEEITEETGEIKNEN